MNLPHMLVGKIFQYKNDYYFYVRTRSQSESSQSEILFVEFARL